MNHIEHMMKLYEEGIDELMGAKKYAKQANKSTNADEKNMYKNMARQELEHAQMLIRDGDRIYMSANVEESTRMIWQPLRDHLLEWHADIMRSVS